MSSHLAPLPCNSAEEAETCSRQFAAWLDDQLTSSSEFVQVKLKDPEKRDARAWTRKTQGLPVVRITGSIRAPIDVVVRNVLITDLARARKFVPELQVLETITLLSERMRVMQRVMKPPISLVSLRESHVLIDCAGPERSSPSAEPVFKAWAGSVISSAAAAKKIPDSVMAFARLGWFVQSKGPNECEYTSFMNLDLGGMVPGPFKKMPLKKAPEAFIAYRKMVEEEARAPPQQQQQQPPAAAPSLASAPSAASPPAPSTYDAGPEPQTCAAEGCSKMVLGSQYCSAHLNLRS